MLSILNYSSVLFYELTPDEIELAGDAGVQDGVLDLEDETAYEGRIYFGLENQSAAGLFLDQITETGLQCRSLSLSKRPFDRHRVRRSWLRVQQCRISDHKPRALDVP